MAKINVTIDDELLERVDNYIKSNYLSRSGLVTLSLNEYLKTRELYAAISSMALSMQRLSSSKEIDDDFKEELEAFYKLANLFTQK